MEPSPDSDISNQYKKLEEEYVEYEAKVDILTKPCKSDCHVWGKVLAPTLIDV